MRDYHFIDFATGECTLVSKIPGDILSSLAEGRFTVEPDATTTREQFIERLRLEIFIRERGLR